MLGSTSNETFPLFPAGGRPLVLAVTSRSLFISDDDYWTHVQLVADSGADLFILREKDLSSAEYREHAERFLSICNARDILPILHSNVDVARELGCRAIHLPIPQLKLMMTLDAVAESSSMAAGTKHVSLLHNDAKPLDDMHESFSIIGASAHSVAEARYAEQVGVDYITISHIFETDCKRGLEPRGLSLIDDVRSACPRLPLIALGGINATNAALAIEQGADGVALMSGLMLADNPSEIVETIHASRRNA